MPEIDGPSAAASPAKPGSGAGPAKPDISGNADLYQIAYQEGQRALDDQQGELRSMRDRGVQFTAFIGAATAFLVGTGIPSAHRDATFYTLAGTASGLSMILIVLLLALLKPSMRNPWNYRLSTNLLIAGYIETDVPLPSEAHFLRALAQRYDQMRIDNEKLLSAVRRSYTSLIVVGVAQLTLWAALVWAKP